MCLLNHLLYETLQFQKKIEGILFVFVTLFLFIGKKRKEVHTAFVMKI